MTSRLAFAPAAVLFLAASVVVPETSHDFGTVKQGARVLHEFRVRNSGTEPLRAERAEMSKPGMTARLPHEVAPGAEGVVVLEWATESVAGSVEGAARIRWSDPALPETVLTMKGTVTPPVSVEPLPIVFLSTFSGESGKRVLRIVSHEEKPLKVERVESPPRTTASLKALEPGRVFELTVASLPDAPPGRYDGTLGIDTDSPAARRLEIPVHLLVKPDVWVNQESVDFGTVPLSTAQDPKSAALLTQTFLVKRRQGAFELKSVTCDNPAISIARSPLGPSDTFQIDVGLRADGLAKGLLGGKIRIETTDARFPELLVSVRGELR